MKIINLEQTKNMSEVINNKHSQNLNNCNLEILKLIGLVV